ncbi:hypothetical protein RCT13_09680 [Escherichia marmotae]|nr:hypothetical protein [Escherichia marmotae]MED8756211.1 hypothetical protein [Escherichia marmotae]
MDGKIKQLKYMAWLGLAWLGLAWLGLAWQHCNILLIKRNNIHKKFR